VADDGKSSSSIDFFLVIHRIQVFIRVMACKRGSSQ
jgi:hypothetical protein